MLRVSHFVGDGPPTEGSVDNLPALLQREGTTWVELFAPTDEEFDSVNRVFHWHPLAIDDLRIETHLDRKSVV